MGLAVVCHLASVVAVSILYLDLRHSSEGDPQVTGHLKTGWRHLVLAVAAAGHVH